MKGDNPVPKYFKGENEQCWAGGTFVI